MSDAVLELLEHARDALAHADTSDAALRSDALKHALDAIGAAELIIKTSRGAARLHGRLDENAGPAREPDDVEEHHRLPLRRAP